jgi:hypothetical protein
LINAKRNGGESGLEGFGVECFQGFNNKIMVVLGIFVLIFFLLLFWLALTPISLHINTASSQYFCKFGSLFWIIPSYDNEDLLIKIKIPFYTFCINPFLPSNEPKNKNKRRIRKRKRSSKYKITLLDIKTLKDLILTFSMKHFFVNVDTGDFVVNAKLTPILLMMSQGPAHFQTNFHGNTHVKIEIENRLIRFIPPVFRYVITKYL